MSVDGSVVIEIKMDNGQVIKGTANIKEKLLGISPAAKKADSGIRNIVTSLGLIKLASAGFNVLKQSMDAAISRFDTMEKYPKVMKSLGFSTEESTKSVNKLAAGIEGLPTRLDDVVSTTQKMTAVTGNINKSTDATIALNNAMLASGSSAEDAKRGMTQYIQMLSTGKVDMQSWKSLQETMPIGLQKTAEAMGFVGKTAQKDLYSALQSGEKTFDDFQNALIEIGTGTGELAKLAKQNSAGIATSFTNLKNSAVKGIANILKAFDKLSEETTGKTIAGNLDSLKSVVTAAFNAIGVAIQMTTPLFVVSAKALSLVYNAGKTLSPVLIGIAAGYASLKIIQGVNSLILASNVALQMAALSGEALTITTKAKMAAQIADTAATKADIIAKSAQNGVVSISTVAIGLLTGGITMQTVATTLATAATTAFRTALNLLMGPVGWVIGGVTALVSAGVALWKWFNKETEASKKLNKQQKELSESTQKLTDATDQNISSRKENLSTIESNSKAYSKVAKNVEDLANKENKTRAEKKLLKDQIEELNSAYEGLNLSYDEEKEKLSMSSKAIQERIDAYGNQEKSNETQAQLVEILKDQNSAEAKLEENTKLRDDWNKKLEEGSVKGGEARKAIEELDEQETLLKENISSLKDEYKTTQDAMLSSTEAVAKAEEEGIMQRIINYETLSESQQKAVDGMKEKWQEYSDSATDMFDTLSDKQTISAQEMIANMEENQRVIGEWADNIAKLSERGIDEGLLNKLREAGPESAGHVATLVNMSDEELAKMNEVFKNGGETATNSLNTAFDLKNSGVGTSIMDMVAGAKTSLKSSIDAADFSSLGKAIPDGISGGVSNNSGKATEAVGKTADDMEKTYRKKTGTHSPSKVYKGFGKNLIEGLANGVNSSEKLVTKSMNSIVKSVKSPFKNTKSDMYTIGTNIIAGLNNGMNDNASSVYNTASEIAANVKRTIQNAMSIKSPSRWMKNFIGKNMMIGWQQGLDNYAQLPVNSAKRASQQVKMPIFKAERIIGNLPSTNRVTNQNYNNNYNNIDAKEDIIVAVSLLKKIADKSNVVIVDKKVMARSVDDVLDEMNGRKIGLRDYGVELDG